MSFSLLEALLSRFLSSTLTKYIFLYSRVDLKVIKFYLTCSVTSHIMSQTVQLYTYLTGWWQAAAAAWMVTWHTKVTSPNPLSEY